MNNQLKCFPSIFSHTELKGDKIILPSGVLSEIQTEEIPLLIFKITSENNSKGITAIVQSFADENEEMIIVPEWIFQNLYIKSPGDLVNIELTHPPVGTRVVLQPQDSLFLTLENHKEILENSIKNFSTLTTGTTITVVIEEYELTIELFVANLFSSDSEAESVSIISTDLQVEFLPPMDYVESKPPDWPPEAPWPLNFGVYIKEEITSQASVDGNKRYILSDGTEIVILKKPVPSSIVNSTVNSQASSAETSGPRPSKKEETNGKFVAFSGKGYSLR